MQCPNNARRYPLPCPRLESEGKCSVNNCSSSDVGRRRPEAPGLLPTTLDPGQEQLPGQWQHQGRHYMVQSAWKADVPARLPMPVLHLHALRASTSNTDKRLICVPPRIPVSAQQLQGTRAYGAASGQDDTGTGPGPGRTAPRLTQGKGRSEEPVQHLEQGAEVTCTKR